MDHSNYTQSPTKYVPSSKYTTGQPSTYTKPVQYSPSQKITKLTEYVPTTTEYKPTEFKPSQSTYKKYEPTTYQQESPEETPAYKYEPSKYVPISTYKNYEPVSYKAEEPEVYTSTYKPATELVSKYKPATEFVPKYEPKYQPKAPTKFLPLKQETPVQEPQTFKPSFVGTNNTNFKPTLLGQNNDNIHDIAHTNKKGMKDKGQGKIKHQSHITGEPHWDKILHHCEETQQPFVDTDFPPTAKNIGGEFELSWERATKFMKKPKVFKGGISASDILQGSLGDCYLLSTLAALCEWHQLIKSLIFSRKENLWGVYASRICWKGVWTEVVIDDFFPVGDDGTPDFSRSTEDETWVLIIEKCWAKLHGNYAKIDGAFAREPMHDFTGAPSRTYKGFYQKSVNSETNKHVWKIIRDGEKNDHAMCVGTFDDGEGDGDVWDNGLFGGHVYTLIAGFHTNINGKKSQIVKLRNPHGEGEWSGALCDKDPIWNRVDAAVKQEIGYGEEDDGIFFMYYEDFCQNFDDVTVCFQYPQLNFRYDGIAFDCSHGWEHYFQVHIEKNGIYFFQVCQRSIRTAKQSIADNVGNNFYSTVWVAIANSKEDNMLQTFYGNRREVCSWKYIEDPKDIPAGDYYIYVKVQSSQYQQDDPVYGFGAYGSDDTEPHEISRESCQHFAELIPKIKPNQYEQCLS